MCLRLIFDDICTSISEPALWSQPVVTKMSPVDEHSMGFSGLLAENYEVGVVSYRDEMKTPSGTWRTGWLAERDQLSSVVIHSTILYFSFSYCMSKNCRSTAVMRTKEGTSHTKNTKEKKALNMCGHSIRNPLSFHTQMCSMFVRRDGRTDTSTSIISLRRHWGTIVRASKVRCRCPTAPCSICLRGMKRVFQLPPT